MYYLTAIAPGTLNRGGKSSKMRTNDGIALENDEARRILTSHPFLVCSFTDDVPPSSKKLIVNKSKFQAGPDAIAGGEALNNVLFDLSANSNPSEVLEYLSQLEELEPVPLANVQKVKSLYKEDRKIQAAADRILSRFKTPPKANSKQVKKEEVDGLVA
jgi:hypothetical protein